MIDPKQLSLPGFQSPKAPTGPKPPGLSGPPKPPGPPTRINGRFLKGPVPLGWLTTASQLPGKTLEVGNVLWFLSGVCKSSTVRLSNKILSEFGVDRYAKRRALQVMAEAKLISVSQKPGQSPVITILEQEG